MKINKLDSKTGREDDKMANKEKKMLDTIKNLHAKETSKCNRGKHIDKEITNEAKDK